MKDTITDTNEIHLSLDGNYEKEEVKAVLKGFWRCKLVGVETVHLETSLIG